MAEYIDREAAIEKLNKLCDRVCQYSKAQRKYMCGACPLGDAFTVIEDDIPAADVRPVVLCKDCKHSAIDLENMRYCKCVVYYNHVSDDWFCADGEKREES